ncbi:MAG: hypothetical protein ACRDVP_12265 [Acidimicrobiales bacterium]
MLIELAVIAPLPRGAQGSGAQPDPKFDEVAVVAVVNRIDGWKVAVVLTSLVRSFPGAERR